MRDIYRTSVRTWGVRTADRTRARLRARFEGIARNEFPGIRRHDLPADLPLRFVNQPPFVIAFDPETRIILRILHAHRDFPGIFG